MSIPFNSAPAHSTRPHHAKQALYVIISGKIPELGEKVTCTCSFLHVIFFVLSVNQSRATFGPNKSPLLHPKNAQNGRVWAQNGKKCTVENCSTTYIYPKTKNNCSLFSSNFHVQRPVSRYGLFKLKFLWERFSQ